MRQTHKSTANSGLSAGVTPSLELHPQLWSLVLLGSSRMLRIAQPTRFVCQGLNPTGDADVLGSLRDGQASCFRNPSSHFQRLANSSGRAARPWERLGRMRLQHSYTAFHNRKRRHPNPSEPGAWKRSRNHLCSCQDHSPGSATRPVTELLLLQPSPCPAVPSRLDHKTMEWFVKGTQYSSCSQSPP